MTLAKNCKNWWMCVKSVSSNSGHFLDTVYFHDTGAVITDDIQSLSRDAIDRPRMSRLVWSGRRVNLGDVSAMHNRRTFVPSRHRIWQNTASGWWMWRHVDPGHFDAHECLCVDVLSAEIKVFAARCCVLARPMLSCGVRPAVGHDCVLYQNV